MAVNNRKVEVQGNRAGSVGHVAAIKLTARASRELIISLRPRSRFACRPRYKTAAASKVSFMFSFSECLCDAFCLLIYIVRLAFAGVEDNVNF